MRMYFGKLIRAVIAMPWGEGRVAFKKCAAKGRKKKKTKKPWPPKWLNLPAGTMQLYFNFPSLRAGSRGCTTNQNQKKKSYKNPKGAKKNTKEHLKKKKRKKNNERKNVNKLIYSRYPISRTAWGSFLLLSFIKDDWNAFRSDTIWK